jgi:hypothetical protein
MKSIGDRIGSSYPTEKAGIRISLPRLSQFGIRLIGRAITWPNEN